MHVKRHGSVERVLAAGLVKELEARFVHYIRAQRLGVAYLQGVLSRKEIKALSRKAESTDSVVLEIVSIVLIADGKGIRRCELVVEAWTEVVASLRSWHRIGKWNDWETGRGGIHDLRVDDGEIVDVANICGEEERCFLAQWTADVAAVLHRVVGRIRGCRAVLMKEGILRVEGGIVAVYGNLSVPFIRAGLGEDFDTAVADFIVLSGERILIDADFADGGFWRQLTSRKAVDIELAAIGTCGRAGESGQVAL